MTAPSKGELVLRHLSQTLNATRRELKELVRTTRDEEFNALMAEVRQADPRLQIREVGTDYEWYYLAKFLGGPLASPKNLVRGEKEPRC
jgi:hypothetical protein